jgi:hypothetical protein
MGLNTDDTPDQLTKIQQVDPRPIDEHKTVLVLCWY